MVDGVETHQSDTKHTLTACWLAGTPNPENEQSLLSEVATFLCYGISVVEQTLHQCQESGQKTQD